MNIQILSDIHLDHAPLNQVDTCADVVVLAGDIAEDINGVLWAKENFDVPVVYVAGNHEYYGEIITMPECMKSMKEEAKGSNVVVLDNDTVVIDGVRFVGTTLWSDLEDVPHALISDEDYILADVADDGRPICFDKPFAQRLFEKNKAWLENVLEEPFAGKTVVVTHHAPSLQSIHSQWANSEWNPCFSSDLESLMGSHVPLWVHGHTHDSFDYTVQNQTRVVCNPRGYPRAFGGWENEYFDTNKVVKV